VFLLGILSQKYVIDRVLHASTVSQVTVTFALFLIIRYGAEAAFGPFTRRVTTSYTGTIMRFDFISFPMTEVAAFVISLSVVTILYLFLTRTYFGVALRAVSQNRNSASLLGINVPRMYRMAFGIGVGVSAVGGTLLSTFYPIYPEMGSFFTLLAFIIVVFGGFGSIFGAYASGIIIGMAETVSALFIPSTLKDVVAFLLFVAIILIKPTGLFGK
jgi:branched-chain amino acid transport system permease protein